MKQTAAQLAADIALKAAFGECVAASIDPRPHEETLTSFLADEVMEAVQEIGVDKKSADPLFALHLRSSFVQSIYFADAGRRAAHALLNHLRVPHTLLTTRRGL